MRDLRFIQRWLLTFKYFVYQELG